MTSHLNVALLWYASLQTLYMVSLATLFAIALGVPIGLFLFASQKKGLYPCPGAQKIVSTLINITRSVPFVILIIALIPLTRWVVGSSIGTTAAIVPLAIAAIPYMARVVENALKQLSPGLIEAAIAMGATPLQSMQNMLLPEARVPIINGTTIMVINLISYSAIAGTVGGGGLGNVAINYGYQRFDMPVMLTTIAILVIMVHAVQFFGDFLAKRLTK